MSAQLLIISSFHANISMQPAPHLSIFEWILNVHISVLICTRFLSYTGKATMDLFSISSVTHQLVLNDTAFSWIIKETVTLSTSNTFFPLKFLICVCNVLDSCGLINDVALHLIQDVKKIVKIWWNQKLSFTNRVDIIEEKWGWQGIDRVYCLEQKKKIFAELKVMNLTWQYQLEIKT